MLRAISKDIKYLAAIDIGTNSFHLVVCEILPDEKFRIIDSAKENVRLGSGGKGMKIISGDAMNRGIVALKRFSEIARSYKATVCAIATSAVREALNQAEFVKLVYQKTKIRIEVVSGAEEGRLIYLGILQSLPVFNEKALIIDIGGGSVEYLIGKKGESEYVNSLEIGCIRLTQAYFNTKSTKGGQIKACRQYIRGFVSSVARETKKIRFDVAVGSSGTILSIANMIRAMKGHDISSQLNNYEFTRDELDAIVKKIESGKTVAARLAIPGMDPKRADIIVAGALVLQESFGLLDIKKMVVSVYALREGIVYDYLHNRSQEKDHHYHLSNIRYRSVAQLCRTFHSDMNHANHVNKIATSIFDQTSRIHGYSAREKEFLEFATLMHEIGFFISHTQHHRHSYYLIRNSELPGFTDYEKEIIANIARYHRKSHPKEKHEGFVKLGPTDQKMVSVLSGILRIADGLDRAHVGKIVSVNCKMQGRKIIFKIRSRSNPELELWAADMKKGLFEETLEREAILRA